MLLIILAAAVGWLVGTQYPGSANWVLGAADSLLERNFSIDLIADDEPAMDEAEDTRADDDEPAASGAAGDDVAAQTTSGSGASDGPPLDQYRTWIREARATHPYPDSEERMYAVMMCESEGRATVVNPAGPYSGLFQYSPATWNGDWNTYRDQDILDPRVQIFATALAWSNGMQGHWGCYSRTH